MPYQWKKISTLANPRMPGVISLQPEPAERVPGQETELQAAAPGQPVTTGTDYQDGFSQGHAEGTAAAVAEQKKLLANLSQLLTQHEQTRNEAIQESVSVVARLMQDVFRSLFAHELTVSPTLLQTLVEKSISRHEEVSDAAATRIYLCPRDYAALTTADTVLTATADDAEEAGPSDAADTQQPFLKLLAQDDSLSPGAIRIDAGDALIDLNVADNVADLLSAAAGELAEQVNAQPGG
ncbi:MAG: FliH/SctL family protein [Pseudomonadota bacterium]